MKHELKHDKQHPKTMRGINLQGTAKGSLWDLKKDMKRIVYFVILHHPLFSILNKQIQAQIIITNPPNNEQCIYLNLGQHRQRKVHGPQDNQIKLP